MTSQVFQSTFYTKYSKLDELLQYKQDDNLKENAYELWWENHLSEGEFWADALQP